MNGDTDAAKKKGELCGERAEVEEYLSVRQKSEYVS